MILTNPSQVAKLNSMPLISMNTTGQYYIYRVSQKYAMHFWLHMTFVQLEVSISNFQELELNMFLHVIAKSHWSWFYMSKMALFWNGYLFLKNMVCTLMEPTAMLYYNDTTSIFSTWYQGVILLADTESFHWSISL